MFSDPGYPDMAAKILFADKRHPDLPPRIYGHFATTSVQIAGDVSLCTEVKKCYFRSISFQDVFLCAGHFFYHFACIICCDLRKNLT